MTKVLVVLSGGQDSTICTAWALSQGFEVHTVSFFYDQKHSIELTAAATVANIFKVPHEIVALGGIFKGGYSPLVSKDHKLETYKDFRRMEDTIGDRVELTFVPGRNAVFLTVAMARAATQGITTVVTGVCQADGQNYPDCRRSFIDALEASYILALGLDKRGEAFAIRTPLMDLSKAESVKLALTLDKCYSALAYSHTAYSGEFPPVTQDHATVLRAHGFEQAGVPDPLMVRGYWQHLLDKLPETENYTKYKAILDPRSPVDPDNMYLRLYNLELYLREMNGSLFSS